MAKRDITQVKQELRILKRENAELLRKAEAKNAGSAEQNRRLRNELRSCQDSQKQLGANCKHYRGRLSDLESVCSELEQQLYLADNTKRAYLSDLEDNSLEIYELKAENKSLKKRRDNLLGWFTAAIVVSLGVEGLRFFGVL